MCILYFSNYIDLDAYINIAVHLEHRLFRGLYYIIMYHKSKIIKNVIINNNSLLFVEGAFVSLRILCKCFIIFIYLSMKKVLEKNNILL